MNTKLFVSLALSFALTAACFSADFFKIHSIKLHTKEPSDKFGVWRFEKNEKLKRILPDEFQPCLEIKVQTFENIRSENTLAKAYFYDPSGKLLAKELTPSKSGTKLDRTHFATPVIFTKNKSERVFFQIPPSIQGQKWTAVIVFGDKKEVQVACYPSNERYLHLDFPEKKVAMNKTLADRKPAIDPLVEHVVRTRNPKHPQLTLFLRPPKGVNSAEEIKGVMAICVLAPSVESMKRELQKEELTGDYNGLFGFANKNKLAIIVWGSQRLWGPGKNFDDYDREKARVMEQNFDTVANAWERGIKELSEKYGIPNKNFFLWGSCGSAQWAHRLCLRKSDYFLAIFFHLPGSFDRPTPEASKVLWCLTTGEMYAGYERSKRFITECRVLGYPIIYKAIPGLGHEGHPTVSRFGFEFLEFALQQRDKREKYDSEFAKENTKSKLLATKQEASPWHELFRNPPYYGDMVNQEMFPSKQVDYIPKGFRVPLPTNGLARMWEKLEK